MSVISNPMVLHKVTIIIQLLAIVEAGKLDVQINLLDIHTLRAFFQVTKKIFSKSLRIHWLLKRVKLSISKKRQK